MTDAIALNREAIGDSEGPASRESIAVIISTRGRPDIVAELARALPRQTRPPDHIFVVAASPDDVAGIDRDQANLTVHLGRVGSSSQRNDGLELAGDRFAYTVFFDDDFVPSRFWLERMSEVFRSMPHIAGLTGTILADGTRTAGIGLEDARSIVERRDAAAAGSSSVYEHLAYGSNMGCNMAFRHSALRDVRFDERLPLYAWLEDHDFRGQVERHGPVARVDSLWGVHLGHKKGRVSGMKFGYSQIANAVYLAGKGTVPRGYLARLAAKNLLINAVRSLRPEPFVDRRGRLAGNIIALGDLALGRIEPERMLAL